MQWAGEKELPTSYVSRSQRDGVGEDVLGADAIRQTGGDAAEVAVIGQAVNVSGMQPILGAQSAQQTEFVCQRQDPHHVNKPARKQTVIHCQWLSSREIESASGWRCCPCPYSRATPNSAFNERQMQNPHVRWRGSCALQAHAVPSPEMATAARPSQPPRTESCVVPGNGHCEA